MTDAPRDDDLDLEDLRQSIHADLTAAVSTLTQAARHFTAEHAVDVMTGAQAAGILRTMAAELRHVRDGLHGPG